MKALIFSIVLFFYCQPIVSAQGELLSKEALEKAQWFYDLEEAMEHPEKVYNLSITWEKLKAFPPEIFKFVNLQHLDLMDNEIREIPADIAQLKNLQILFLSNNKLATLPKELTELEHLEVLHLERNRLETLPDWIDQITKLNKVGLRENKLDDAAIEALNAKYSKIEITK